LSLLFYFIVLLSYFIRYGWNMHTLLSKESSLISFNKIYPTFSDNWNFDLQIDSLLCFKYRASVFVNVMIMLYFSLDCCVVFLAMLLYVTEH